MNEKLSRAAVVEIGPPYDVKQAVNSITGTDVPFVSMSSLSPSKIILFFEDDVSLELALVDSSPLRDLFTDVRRWSKTEQFVERLVWLECVGMNPCLWSYDNFRRIGEIWGKTVRVNHEYNGIISLTSAKILIQTTTLKTIETCVKLQWTSGSCEVWVNEMGEGECQGCCPTEEEPQDDHTKKLMDSNNGVKEEGIIHHSTVRQMIENNTQQVYIGTVGDINEVTCTEPIEEGEKLVENNEGEKHEQRVGVPTVAGNIMEAGEGRSNGEIEGNTGLVREESGNHQNVVAVGGEHADILNTSLENVELNENGVNEEA
ncbi:unnamed protein product [Amaranthus hypochondriacus]